jgi:predicted phage terminase large subunit-like protein
MAEDLNFPRFDLLVMPAKSNAYPSGYLFPERYSAEWYEQQFSALGQYRASALLQCDPRPRSGNLFKVDNLRRQSRTSFPDVVYIRAWDLASSEAERLSDDPDWTVGALIGVERITEQGINYDRLWIKEAPQRNEIIMQTAINDGASVSCAIESVAGYKDAYTTLADILYGVRTVYQVTTSRDKVVRCSSMEPLFESGNVILSDEISPENIEALLNELAGFPRARHDDAVDAVATGYNWLKDTSTAPYRNIPASGDRNPKSHVTRRFQQRNPFDV